MFRAHPLSHLIPSRNTFSAEPMTPATSAVVLSSLYSDSGGFVGAFCANSERGPTWANRVANYDRDEFRHDTPGNIKRFSELPTARIQPGAGKGQRSIVWRHALEQWRKNGSEGPLPFSCYQDYGSCVDAEASERITAMAGWRAAQPTLRERFRRAAAWYRYANRGFCSDGWSGWACAKVALQIGVAWRQKYDEGDFEDDDKNEQIVARTWCRNGVPKSLAERTQREHPHKDGSITDFDGGMEGLRDVLLAGGTIATGGVVTSGGSRPFTPGRVGPHMQGIGGFDDTDEYRKFIKDRMGYTLPENDFALVFNQTWGEGWSGECADQYWPDFWGEKPQGAWVCLASWALRNFEGDMLAWLPDFVGVADPNPVPPNPVPPPAPPGPIPPSGVVVGGQVTLNGKAYILVPKPEL
jgi:hypothetical protein